MNTYPGIYGNKEPAFLYIDERNFYRLKNKEWCIDEGEEHAHDKNLTHEYLANTYGKVESKEHADFIIELAEGAGFGALEYLCTNKWFRFTEKYLYFYNSESRASDAKEKLITIPLPPKEPESKEPESKEWPQVGDEVLTASKLKAVVVAVNENQAWVRYKERLYGNQVDSILTVGALSKPPTPEEELANKLDEAASATIDIDDLVKLSESIINGEIKGLSYNPE